MSEWQERLEGDLNEILKKKNPSPRPRPQQIQIPPRKEEKDWSLAMFLFVLLLGVGVAIAWRWKNPTNNYIARNNYNPNVVDTRPSDGWRQSDPQQHPQFDMREIQTLKDNYKLVDGKADKLLDRTQVTREKLTLLAIINNHNLVVLRDNHPKSELILLNEDWTINKLPNRLRMDEQDRAFLQRFLRGYQQE